jgi:hypothetical protein
MAIAHRINPAQLVPSLGSFRLDTAAKSHALMPLQSK